MVRGDQRSDINEMKTESEWLSCKPLAEANLPSWIRAIQADALLFAVDHGSSTALNQAKQLKDQRDDFTNQPASGKDRLFHELVVLVTGMRACLLDVIEDSGVELVSRELARVEEADVLLKACEAHKPKLEQIKEWEKRRTEEGADELGCLY